MRLPTLRMTILDIKNYVPRLLCDKQAICNRIANFSRER